MASSPENVQVPFTDLAQYTLVGSSNQKKSWQELRGAIRKIRSSGMKIINRVPHNFTFKHIQTPDGHRTRLYFLGVPSGSRENTLLYVDIQPPSENVQELLEWNPLLDSFSAIPHHGQFSKEEQLLRERKRLGSFGITSYDYDADSGQFVFPACNSLFSYCDSTIYENITDLLVNVQPFPTELKSNGLGTRLDPKMNPSNPNLLGYICNNDVWITNCTSGTERRLTHAHIGNSSLAGDPKSAGVPSFVVQEEFDRYTGYWWQPETEKSSDPIYRILYEEVDESDVEILNLASASPDCKGTDEFRYPRAGTPNARCVLKMLEFKLDEHGEIVDVVHKQLLQPLTSQFPWMEYILRAGWTPDGKYVYAQLLDRQQKRLAMILIPFQSFSLPCDSDIVMDMIDLTSEQKQGQGNGDTDGYEVPSPLVLSPSPNGDMDTVIESELSLHVIYEDTSEIWINVHDIIHFFPQNHPSEISFIWASEKSGYRHLYHVTSSLTKPTDSLENPASGLSDSQEACRSSVIKELPLTNGDWEVCIKQVWVDEKNKLVYFTALKDHPLETHMYVVSYENPGAILRLTELGYTHMISMDKECSLFVTVYSSINKPPASTIYKLHHTNEKIVPVPIGCLLQQEALSDDYHPPELFDYESSSGHRMYGMLYKPHNLQPGKKYPTVNYVYGGPQVQMVSNSYKGIRLLRLHTLASLGYTVVVIDTRGSSQRGLHFESHIKDKLGTVEIADQVEGLHWLAEKYDWIDLSRVAIHGWSYGGYLSLMGLAQRPDVYKVAVAGAPVTSWYLYDTGYTERYLGLPSDNIEGYRQGSVLEYINRIPSEENRLMIVHGLIDENVHFFHTSVLINALIKACKPYQLQVYPNERHGIRNPDASEHHEAMVLSFLQQNLMFASPNNEDTYL